MALVTLQTIFQDAFPAYEQRHALPAHVRRAAHALMQCRTAALGGHIQACPDGHVSRVWYNSCRHRSCPQCAYLQTERWLARQWTGTSRSPSPHSRARWLRSYVPPRVPRSVCHRSGPRRAACTAGCKTPCRARDGAAHRRRGYSTCGPAPPLARPHNSRDPRQYRPAPP
jgi:Transposase zinc-binding domain